MWISFENVAYSKHTIKIYWKIMVNYMNQLPNYVSMAVNFYFNRSIVSRLCSCYYLSCNNLTLILAEFSSWTVIFLLMSIDIFLNSSYDDLLIIFNLSSSLFNYLILFVLTYFDIQYKIPLLTFLSISCLTILETGNIRASTSSFRSPKIRSYFLISYRILACLFINSNFM